MIEPTNCDRAGCIEPTQSYCLSCSRPFCMDHLAGDRSHVCLEAVVIYNADHVLDDDEAAVAIERFRPI